MTVFTKRSWLEVVLFTIITFGIYGIYWTVSTKRELNRAGGRIPCSILMFIPIVHFYFWYRYIQNYIKIVRHSEQEMDILVYFLLAVIIPGVHVICMAILQNGYNTYSPIK